MGTDKGCRQKCFGKMHERGFVSSIKSLRNGDGKRVWRWDWRRGNGQGASSVERLHSGKGKLKLESKEEKEKGFWDKVPFIRQSKRNPDISRQQGAKNFLPIDREAEWQQKNLFISLL